MKDATLAQGNQVLNLILQKQIPSSLIDLKPLNAFTVSVNYNLSVEDAVKSGKYSWSNYNITTKNFPSKWEGAADVEIILVHFNRCMESYEAIREFDKQGLRPAELLEGLAFGAKYPDIQRDFPIVILGSVWQFLGGDYLCAYLNGDGSRRALGLGWFDDGWGDGCRFAVVRE